MTDTCDTLKERHADTEIQTPRQVQGKMEIPIKTRHKERQINAKTVRHF